MRFRRKTFIFTALFLCLVLLAGCSSKSDKGAGSALNPWSGLTPEHSEEESEEHSDEDTGKLPVDVPTVYTSSQSFSSDAGTSIDVLREEIGQSTALFGVAYIGQFDREIADMTGIDYEQWFSSASSPLAAYYPFVSEIDEAHTIGTEGHLYCVIAKDYGSSICVSRAGDDTPLYTAKNGDPFLLFSNLGGNAQKADTVVTVTTADGTEYRWEPTLDELGYPQLLIGDERELLSWDFTPLPDTGFDLEGWLTEGWLGPNATGLAYDSDGRDWWIETWDGSVSYCLHFYLNGGGSYDGEVSLECFYAGDSTMQAQWQGWWRIETEADQPSRLYIDMMLYNGADKAAFESSAAVSESYRVLLHPSGEYVLLVADDGAEVVLPIFPDGVQAVELTLSEG